MSLSLRRVALSGFTAWMVVLVFALYFLYPLRKTLTYGIDLVGGSYITLEVQTDKALESALRDKMEAVIGKLKKAKKDAPEVADIKNGAIVLKFKSVAQAQDAIAQIKRDERELVVNSENDTVTVAFAENYVKRIKDEAVARNIEVLRTRLDKLSVAEINIATRGERSIVVELPDVQDSQQAKSMIGTAAVLEFRIVEREGRSAEEILYEYDGQLPAGMEILPGKPKGDHQEFYLVQKRAPVTGKDLKDARPQFDEQRAQMVVSFTMTSDGADKFYDFTSKFFGRTMAAVLDGVVITAAKIAGKISTNGMIYNDGGFATEEVKDLCMMLKSGSFVAPVTFEEERTIEATLGKEAIHQGLIACLIGLGLLFVFSVVFYSLSGILAFLALSYNLVLILVGMSWLHATLTLPGIAGMVLTVGMAIDASILIFERIREELASGVSVRKAVNDGFSEAMRVILDSNITTFITALVLYKFGTGPVQGFAMTTMLGIIATLITGLFFLKSLFIFTLDLFNVQKLRI